MIADVVFLEWEILRFHRLKANLTNATIHKALEELLPDLLDHELCSEELEEAVIEFLQKKNLIGDKEKHYFQKLARRCARNEADAIEEFYQLLDGTGLDIRNFRAVAEVQKAKKLARAYGRREPAAIEQVNELLAAKDRSMQDLISKGLTETIGKIERIDRLITIAESRRNASLREIDRRRAVLGATLRRSVQEIEDGEFEVIETAPAKRKNAA